MLFTPSTAISRFGLGHAPYFKGPADVAAVLADITVPDAVALAHPIAGFAAAEPSLLTLAKGFRAERQARGTANAAEQADRVTALRRAAQGARRQHIWRTYARAVDAPIGFRERLVLFWADHFTVIARAGHQRHLVSSYIEDAIRPHVGGPFVNMLRAVEKHPMMLLYLQQARSIGPNSVHGQRRGGGLNENLAREMLELHTVGLDGGYDQRDVEELAALLSGLTYNHEAGAHFDADRAEPGAETVLGAAYGPEATEGAIDQVLEALASNPATARHLALKLARHFIADDPPAELVEDVAAAYRETQGDLTACYAALLAHPAAWDPVPRKVRPPFDFLVAGMRALGVTGAEIMAMEEQTRRRLLVSSLPAMGQPWQTPSGPDGWADSETDWIIPQTMAARVSWALQAPRLIRDPLPDPRDLVQVALGPNPDPTVVFAASAAETRADGIAVIFASPAFQRR